MERIDALEKQGGSAAQMDDQLENMEGFDPKLQGEIQKKREYVESLKMQIAQMKEQRNQTKMIQMQQNMPGQDQMDDGMRAGTDEQ